MRSTNRRTRLQISAVLLIAISIPPELLAQRSPPIRFSRDTVAISGPQGWSRREPQMAASGEAIFVTWNDRPHSMAQKDIYFNRSLDGGATWLASDVRLDTDPPRVANSINPRIAAEGQTVCVVWEDNRLSGVGWPGVYFNRSLDGGTTWLPSDIRLDSDHLVLSSAHRPEIAVSGKDVFVTWHTESDEVYFRSSPDCGSTWPQEAVKLNTTAPDKDSAELPKIALSGDAVYVAWIDDRHRTLGYNEGVTDVYINRSLDRGVTWLSSDVRVNTDPPGRSGRREHQLVASGDSCFVVWRDDRNTDASMDAEDIYFNRSLDGGLTWMSSDIRIDTDPVGGGHSIFPQLGVSGDSVYVIWFDDRLGANTVFFNRSMDEGATWLAEDVRIDNNQGSGVREIKLTAAGESVYAIWSHHNFIEWGVYFNRSLDHGSSWLPQVVRIDKDTPGTGTHIGNSTAPDIATTGDSVYIAWQHEALDYRHLYFNIPFGAHRYGEGTSGSGGYVPKLLGTNNANVGNTISLSVTDGLGAAIGVLAMGGSDSKASLPLVGGELLVFPIRRLTAFMLDGTAGVAGEGSTSVQIQIPADSSFLGANFNFQAALLDAMAVGGLSLSNGVEVWIL